MTDTATFQIRAEPARDLILIRMAGFFTPADIERFVAARARAHAELRCGPNRHVTLNDLREMKIQSQGSVAGFGAMLADPAYRSRKLAFVVSATLARSQLRRALGSRDAECFGTVAEAESWLFAPEQRAA
jgi:hypothetical protein